MSAAPEVILALIERYRLSLWRDGGWRVTGPRSSVYVEQESVADAVEEYARVYCEWGKHNPEEWTRADGKRMVMCSCGKPTPCHDIPTR